MGRFEGRTAVVTGGASGLGEAMVRLFVAEGGRVVIADVQEDRGSALAEELGDAAVFANTDVTDEAAVAAAVDLAVGHFGALDAMCNNAGIVGVVGPIADTPMELYDRTMAILLRGRVPRRQARRPGDDPPGHGRRHRQRRQHGRAARRPGPSRLQRGQVGRHRPHPVGRLRARPVRHPGDRRRAGRDPDASHRGGHHGQRGRRGGDREGPRRPLAARPHAYDLRRGRDRPVPRLRRGQLRQRPDASPSTPG